MTDSSNGVIWVYTTKLESAFRKVKEIQEFIRTYVLAPSGIKISVEDIQWAIEQKYGLKINKELIDFEADHVRGMMERYADGVANVLIRAKQDDDEKTNGYWHRFIAVKEMAHLAIDEKEDWSTDGEETLDDLIKEHEIDRGRPPKDGIQSEVLAEIAAIELLYPMEFRQGDIEKNTPHSELATVHEVPQYVIQRALSSNHMKRARAMWNEIGGHNLGGVGSNPTGKKAK